MIEIRPAELPDLTDIHRIHRSAFAHSIGVSLGRSYTSAFLRRYIEDPLAIALVASIDSSTGGYAVGANTAAASETTRRLALWAAIGLITHPWMLINRAVRKEAIGRLPFSGRRPPPDTVVTSEVFLPAPIYSLVGIGTLPCVQRKGVGRALLTAFELEAERKGAASVRLSVYKDNMAARQLYSSREWKAFDHPTNERVLYYGRSLR